MDVLQTACYQAQMVLIQERRESTLTYRSDDPVRAFPFNGLSDSRSDVTQRNAYYRRVSEATPPTLVSQNYGLLLAVFGKLDPGDRRGFLLWTIKQLLMQDAYDRRRSDILQAGRAATTTAESPLIAEFSSGKEPLTS